MQTKFHDDAAGTISCQVDKYSRPKLSVSGFEGIREIFTWSRKWQRKLNQNWSRKAAGVCLSFFSITINQGLAIRWKLLYAPHNAHAHLKALCSNTNTCCFASAQSLDYITFSHWNFRAYWEAIISTHTYSDSWIRKTLYKLHKQFWRRHTCKQCKIDVMPIANVHVGFQHRKLRITLMNKQLGQLDDSCSDSDSLPYAGE